MTEFFYSTCKPDRNVQRRHSKLPSPARGGHRSRRKSTEFGRAKSSIQFSESIIKINIAEAMPQLILRPPLYIIIGKDRVLFC